jgi:hypothetical protein
MYETVIAKYMMQLAIARKYIGLEAVGKSPYVLFPLSLCSHSKDI